MGHHIKAKVTDMLNSRLKSLSIAALAAVWGCLLVPGGATAATPVGAVLAPGALPVGLSNSIIIEKVQQHRRARRRGIRRGNRGVRRGRHAGRRLFRRHGGRRYRGPYLAFPRFVAPPYYYSDPYYDYPAYDPYYGGYDNTPAPPPRGGSCARWSRRCTANWGYGNGDYWGCMRYHGCD